MAVDFAVGRFVELERDVAFAELFFLALLLEQLRERGLFFGSHVGADLGDRFLVTRSYHLGLVEQLFEFLHKGDRGLGSFGHFADQQVGPELEDVHAFFDVFGADVGLEDVADELCFLGEFFVELFVLGGLVVRRESHKREDVLLVEVVEDDSPDFLGVGWQQHLRDVVAGVEDRHDELFLQ